MSILVTTLLGQLAREMGDTDTSNLYYSADQLFSALNDGITSYNEDSSTQQYSKAGSGDAETIDPTPSDEDSRLIVYYAAIALTEGEIAKSARASISISNPAGRIDLTSVVEALEKFIERLEGKIENIKRNRGHFQVESDSDTWGAELRGKPTDTSVPDIGLETTE